jgi:hypothetical protein
VDALRERAFQALNQRGMQGAPRGLAGEREREQGYARVIFVSCLLDFRGRLTLVATPCQLHDFDKCSSMLQ